MSRELHNFLILPVVITESNTQPLSLTSATEPMSPPAGSPGSDDIPLLVLVTGALRHLRMIFIIGIAALIATVAVVLPQRRTYSASASFLPQARGAQGGLAGLAAQLGATMTTGDISGPTPDFYVDFLKSRPLLQEVATAQYEFKEDGQLRRGDLMQLYDISAPSPVLRLERAVIRLRGAMLVSTLPKTGVVRFTVTASDSALARQIAQNILTAINRFNLEARQSKARAERQFTEQRVTELKGELRLAEDRVESFMSANRSVESDPSLQMQLERLRRESMRVAQVYSAVSQQYEQARLDEVRDTPLITLVEEPAHSVLPDPRGLVKKSVLALLLGLFMGSVIAAIRELSSGRPLSVPAVAADYHQLMALRMRQMRQLTWLRPRSSSRPSGS